jgi:hypothetical protein
VESSGCVRLERISGIASRKIRRYQVAMGSIVAVKRVEHLP